jgi:hypothetical protein
MNTIVYRHRAEHEEKTVPLPDRPMPKRRLRGETDVIGRLVDKRRDRED